MSNFKKIKFLVVLLLAFTAINLSAQTTVKGVVKDSNGEEVIGATILEQGTKNGTTTDLNGQFTLKVEGKKPLIISYVGMKTQLVNVIGKTNVNVVLQDDVTSLNDVVVIGYGTIKKRDLTGAISQVDEADIRQAPVVNAMEGLQGKIAGLDIVRESGQAGTSPKILLRGNRSLGGISGADCSPLYVIDGVSGGSLDNVNPNDIENIEVLKDASSTAIYGAAGANGVIIVTTRQGIKGKTQVDFNAYVGINAWPSYPSTLSKNAWIDYLQEGYRAKNNINNTLPVDISTEALFQAAGLSTALDAYLNNKWIDWKKEVLHTGVQQNYNVSVRGGSDKMQSYMSAGYQNEKGLYKNDKLDLFTFRAGTNYQINNIVSAGFQATMSYRNKDSRNSYLNKTLNQVPLGDLYGEDGTIKVHPIDGMNSYVNLLADEQEGVFKNNNKSTNIKIAPFIEIKPFKGLTFKTLFNASMSNGRTGKYQGLDTYAKTAGSSAPRDATYSTSNSWSYMWQNVLTYNFKINKQHDFTVTGVTEYSKGRYENSSAYNEGFDYDDFLYYNLGAGLRPTVGSGYSETSSMSYAGRLNYSFLGRYLVSASIRWDGYSQLFKKWDTFPAFSVGWRVSDEPFMESTRNWLDNLKLRAGYGITGNANIPAYVSLTKVTNSPNELNLGNGQVMSYILDEYIGNKELTWEKSYNWNIGIDFSLFNSRIDGSVEYYTTDSKGVLYAKDLPSVYGSFTGASAYKMYSNIARIRNHGVEITLNTRNVVNKDFTWSTTFTFAANKEQVKEIDLGNNINAETLKSKGLFIGQPVTTYFGYKKEGIWQIGDEDRAACFGRMPGDVRLGTTNLVWDPNYTYTGFVRDNSGNILTDENGNQITKEYHGAYYNPAEDGENGEHVYYTSENNYTFSEVDKQILGHKVPDWTMGLQNQFTWKGFDLTIDMVMRWGQMVNGNLLGWYNASDANVPESYDYWTYDNPTNCYPRPQFEKDMKESRKEEKASLTYVNGSFFKIKNISLGYTFPNRLIDKLGLTKLRVYGTIQNPIIINKERKLLKGMDPESGCTDAYPLFRTMVFGVNVSF